MTETDLGALLKSRGLVISDEAKAVRYLESIGYYRLSAYMYPFLKVPKESHQYKEGTTFQQVLNLYRFDKKLRMLLLNEIEKVDSYSSCHYEYSCTDDRRHLLADKSGSFCQPKNFPRHKEHH